MQFLKKHYEKLVLSLVLLAVALAAFLLIVEVSNVQENLNKALETKQHQKVKPIKPTDLTTNQATLEMVAHPKPLILSGPDNNTFNPITYVRGQDGKPVPQSRKVGIGPSGLELVNLNPLLLEISFTGVAGTPEAPRYQFSVKRDYEKKSDRRRPTVMSLTEGARNELFILREIKGPKESPTELVCALIEGGEVFSVTPTKAFSRVMGYSADLRYEIEKKDLSNRRVDESFPLSGVTYKIVAIAKDEVVISSPNQVRTTVKKVSGQ
ncbi:MAG TPA: hypothetical protein VMF06_05040 [Candidatus Limnocylindria bacterium]|jgi:hypothetical protein|nr:hypothetical protein [Candidatus Limnocylindria bacterium]